MAEAKIVVTADTKRAERALGRVNGGLGSITGAARAATAAIAAIGVGTAIRNIVQATARFQDLRDTLASVTGSTVEGAEAFEYLTELQSKTQFGVNELANSFIQLTANGVTPASLGLENMNQLFAVLTDSAAAVNGGIDVLQATTSVLARSIANGSVELEELNRLSDRGIPVFSILNDRLNLTKDSINEFSKEGDNASLVLRELVAGIQERFGGATARRLDNVTTQFSNLRNAVDLAQEAIGRQGLGRAVGQTTERLTVFLNESRELQQQIGIALTTAFLRVVAVSEFLIKNIELIGKAFIGLIALKVSLVFINIARAIVQVLIPAILLLGKTVRTVFLLMLPGGPLIKGAIVGITALATTFGLLKDSAEDSGNGIMAAIESLTGDLGVAGIDKLKEQWSGASEQAAEYSRQANQAAEGAGASAAAAADTANSTGQSAGNEQKRANSLKEIVSSAEEELALARASLIQNDAQRKVAQAEVRLGDELTSQEREQLTALYEQTRAVKEQAESRREILSIVDEVNEATTQGLEQQLAQLDQAEARYQELYGNNLEAEREFQARRAQLIEQANARIEQIEMARIERTLRANQSGVAQQLSQEDRAFLQRKGQQERQEEITRDRIEFEKKSEGEKAQFAIQKGAEVFSALGAQNKKAFEAAKALNIANALMNTYAAATKALATYPFPFGLVAAAAAVAAGMAQVSAIRSQQYSGRSLGGPVLSNQSYIVGESGPELFTPTSNGSITRNNQMSQGQGTSVNFTIVANDTTGFDELLTSRQGLIRTIISDAMLENGQRSMV